MEIIDVILLSFALGAFVGYLLRRFEQRTDEQLAYLRGESDTLDQYYGIAVRSYLRAHLNAARNATPGRSSGA